MKIDEHDEVVVRLRADAQRIDDRVRPITTIEIEQRVAAGQPAPAPRSRVRGVLAATVASVLAIAVFAVWTAGRSTESAPASGRLSTPSTVEQPQTASVSAHPTPWTGPPLYMEPSYVPAGFTLVTAEGGDPGAGGSSTAGSSEIKAEQSWVRFDAGHDAATATLGIEWGPGARADRPNGKPYGDDPLAGWEPGSVKITVRGRSGWYSPRLSGIAWEEPVGQAASVSCQQCSRDELLQIANGLVRRSDGGFRWPHPIDGFQFINEAPGMASDGTDVRQLFYRGPNNTGFAIAIVDDTDEPPFSQLGFPQAQIADVRNTQGVIGPRLNAPFSGRGDISFIVTPTLFLQWLEYPNVAITTAGKDIGRAELLAIANSLRPISAQRWTALGGSTASPTTTVTEAPTSTPTKDRTTVQIANGGDSPIVVSPDGLTLVLGVPTCNGAPTARVEETTGAVHLLVTSDSGSYLTCFDALSVRLKTPLGSRVVIDDKTGHQVATRPRTVG